MPSLTIKQRKARNGYLYILPWMVGMLSFFIPAMITTIYYSFCNVEQNTFVTNWAGFANYYRAFREDAKFIQLLADILLKNLKEIPLILVFSYFVALLLKKPFPGKTIVKCIFFLTVILSSDMFMTMQIEMESFNTALVKGVKENSESFFTTINGAYFADYLQKFGISPSVTDFLENAVHSIADIFNKSGVQIFIFAAGLSSIPDSMYEAASIEGATSWEIFWKITFPMTTSIIIVNFVYTVIDSFNSMLSPALQYINNEGFKGGAYGYGSAMSIIYFICMGVAIAFVLLLTRKKVFYYV